MRQYARRALLAAATLAAGVATLVGLLGPAPALADSSNLVTEGTLGDLTVLTAPSGILKDTFFICPSVSTNNSQGTWVIGFHGGYYVLIPGPGSKVFIDVPVTVPDVAGSPAGWALYNTLPSYPNFVGTAMLLQEGIEHWLGSPAGWQEGDTATVVDNGNGSYTVTDLQLGQSITIDHAIPLASAAIW